MASEVVYHAVMVQETANTIKCECGSDLVSENYIRSTALILDFEPCSKCSKTTSIQTAHPSRPKPSDTLSRCVNCNKIATFTHFMNLAIGNGVSSHKISKTSRINYAICSVSCWEDFQNRVHHNLQGTRTIHGCQHCRKNNPTKKCQACKIAHYCDRQCQVADWPKHKECCHAFADSSDLTSLNLATMILL